MDNDFSNVFSIKSKRDGHFSVDDSVTFKKAKYYSNGEIDF